MALRCFVEIEMTHKSEEYEFARKIIKREERKPNSYSQNRKEAILHRVYKLEGERALKEIAKEFKL